MIAREASRSTSGPGAALAKPAIDERLEALGIRSTIRLPANRVQQECIARLPTCPVGRPPSKLQVFFASFSYRARTWIKPRRVVARVERHRGRHCPRVGFKIANPSRPIDRVVKFTNGCGTDEQWIGEVEKAIRWTGLSCLAFRHNAVRLQLHALADNLANFMRASAPPEKVEHWPLTTAREKLVKIGARIVRHGR